MSIETETNSNDQPAAIAGSELSGVVLQAAASTDSGRLPKRKKKLSSQVNMWIRRIHLFSGLFMLPWVLLYGFTALLFNHPTYMTDTKTEIETFSLSSVQTQVLPNAQQIAEQAIETANEQLQAEGSSQVIELAAFSNAIFTRQVSGSVEDDQRSVSVILNLNDGKGYLRKKSKDPSPEPDKSENEQPTTKDLPKPVTIEDGLNLVIEDDPVKSLKIGVSDLLKPYELDSEKLSIRSMPNVEFDAMVDGQPVRLRLAQQQNRGRRPVESESPESSEKQIIPAYKVKLTLVGGEPRELSARSFLLRLHMAHGYGIQTNSRWFWAIAVDLMFASMCFWGLSGLVMWWQIKRTRKIGFLLLIASAIAATWLAIGMHWQLVNG